MTQVSVSSYGFIKTPYYSHGFRPETENFNFSQNSIVLSSERACKREQNGTNVSFVAPSSKELRRRKLTICGSIEVVLKR